MSVDNDDSEGPGAGVRRVPFGGRWESRSPPLTARVPRRWFLECRVLGKDLARRAQRGSGVLGSVGHAGVGPSPPLDEARSLDRGLESPRRRPPVDAGALERRAGAGQIRPGPPGGRAVKARPVPRSRAACARRGRGWLEGRPRATSSGPTRRATACTAAAARSGRRGPGEDGGREAVGGRPDREEGGRGQAGAGRRGGGPEGPGGAGQGAGDRGGDLHSAPPGPPPRSRRPTPAPDSPRTGSTNAGSPPRVGTSLLHPGLPDTFNKKRKFSGCLKGWGRDPPSTTLVQLLADDP